MLKVGSFFLTVLIFVLFMDEILIVQTSSNMGESLNAKEAKLNTKKKTFRYGKAILKVIKKKLKSQEVKLVAEEARLNDKQIVEQARLNAYRGTAEEKYEAIQAREKAVKAYGEAESARSRAGGSANEEAKLKTKEFEDAKLKAVKAKLKVGLTAQEANSNSDCTYEGRGLVSNSWCCGGGYHGCVIGSSCPDGSRKYPHACDDASERYANCKGCMRAGKTYCVVTLRAISLTATKCIERIDDDKLSEGHFDCPNGKIYNKCVETTPDDVVPAKADIYALPEARVCTGGLGEGCLERSSMGWCVSRTAPFYGNYCLPTSKESQCRGTFYKRSLTGQTAYFGGKPDYRSQCPSPLGDEFYFLLEPFTLSAKLAEAQASLSYALTGLAAVETSLNCAGLTNAEANLDDAKKGLFDVKQSFSAVKGSLFNYMFSAEAEIRLTAAQISLDSQRNLADANVQLAVAQRSLFGYGKEGLSCVKLISAKASLSDAKTSLTDAQRSLPTTQKSLYSRSSSEISKYCKVLCLNS